MEGIIIRLLLLLSSVIVVHPFSSTSYVENAALLYMKSIRRPARFQIHTTTTKIHLISQQTKYSGDELLHPIAHSRFWDGGNQDRIKSSLFIFSSDKDVEDEAASIECAQNSTNATTINEEEVVSLGMESGWANFGRYLLPSWSSFSSSHSTSEIPSEEQTNNSTMSEENSTVAEDSDTSFVHTIFSPKKDYEEISNVIDVECSVDEPDCVDADVITANGGTEEQVNTTLTKQLLRGTLSALKHAKHGGKKVLEVGKKIKDKRKEDDISSSTTVSNSDTIRDGEPLLNETLDNTTDSIESSSEPREDSSNKNQTRRGNRRRHSSNNENSQAPIFTSLESKDINTTTMSKQRRWDRRRKRVMLLVGGMKNAMFLFIATFLAGNVSGCFWI